jgi:ADP-ribose pyrophosphatase YjhB (NUDIX family)
MQMKKTPRKGARQSISSRKNKGRRGSRNRHREEVSAGGLVFKKTSRGVFFAMLKDSYGKWTFPKGHVAKKESYEEGARREIFEEMHVKDLHLIRKLGTIDIWFRDRFVFKGRLIHKYIHYYLFEVKENVRLEKPKPTPGGERIQAVAWVPASEVVKRSNYKDMKPIIRKAFEILGIQV